MDAMDKGHYYWMLGKTAIIFICTFDYFGEGRHIYTFHQRCDEDNAIQLRDGTTKVFLNAKGTMDDVDDDLRAFLDYVAGKQVNHPVVDELDAVVQKVKHNKDWRSEYMRYEHELAAREHLAREDGRREGRKEGRDFTIVASIKSLIKNIKATVDEAMNMLDIPMADRSKYLALLKN